MKETKGPPQSRSGETLFSCPLSDWAPGQALWGITILIGWEHCTSMGLLLPITLWNMEKGKGISNEWMNERCEWISETGKVKEVGHKKPQAVCFHWCERSRIGTLETESESEVTQSCLTLCNPHGLPVFSIHGILYARVLEWVAISFSSESSWPRDRTLVSRIAGRCFNLWATRDRK